MMENILNQLKKLDNEEDMFGKELIDSIQYGECMDGYAVKISEFPVLILKKDDELEDNYISLVLYLTDIKNRLLNASDPHDETKYYHDWMIFKGNYNTCKALFYLKIKNTRDADAVNSYLIDTLGKVNYYAISCLLNTDNENYNEHAKNVMWYIGNTRAVRDLCIKHLDSRFGTQWPFHLWHLTPTDITETYGHVFYLGNEMSSLEYCPYDYQTKESYYRILYRKLFNNMEKALDKKASEDYETIEEYIQEVREKLTREIPDLFPVKTWYDLPPLKELWENELLYKYLPDDADVCLPDEDNKSSNKQ